MSRSLEEFRLIFSAKEAEFSYYAELNELVVDACDSDVSDDDIALLAEFPDNLIYLNLAGTQATNRVLRSISMCTRLEFLDLGRTRCDENCLESLLGFHELVVIRLSGIALTDRVVVLAQLKKLESLDLSGTGVPKDAVHALLRSTALSSVMLGRNGLHPSDFSELEDLEENSRTVCLWFDDDVCIGLAIPPVEENVLRISGDKTGDIG